MTAALTDAAVTLMVIAALCALLTVCTLALYVPLGRLEDRAAERRQCRRHHPTNQRGEQQ